MAFWEEKKLNEMSFEEFEALCDNCGRCCLVKLEDEDSGEILISDVHCKLFDADICRCADYENRQEIVPDCVKLTPNNIKSINWIPYSCAYRTLAENRALAAWHPLVSGNPETVEKAGMSVKGLTVCETKIKPNEWVEHITQWQNWYAKEKF